MTEEDLDLDKAFKDLMTSIPEVDEPSNEDTLDTTPQYIYFPVSPKNFTPNLPP